MGRFDLVKMVSKLEIRRKRKRKEKYAFYKYLFRF